MASAQPKKAATWPPANPASAELPAAMSSVISHLETRYGIDAAEDGELQRLLDALAR